MDQAELDKGNLNAKKSEIQRYVLEQRDKVDVQLNQRDFNEMKSANADSASVVTKGKVLDLAHAIHVGYARTKIQKH